MKSVTSDWLTPGIGVIITIVNEDLNQYPIMSDPIIQCTEIFLIITS